MTAPLFAPAFARQRHDARALLYSAAFAPNMLFVTPRAVTGTPRFAKTPKTDDVAQFPGVADLCYDRGSDIVHDAHFLRLNIDARLVSFARAYDIAPFESLPPPNPKPKLDSQEITFPSENGTRLAGVMTRPPGFAKKIAGDRLHSAGRRRRSKHRFALRGYAAIRYTRSASPRAAARARPRRGRVARRCRSGRAFRGSER